MRYALKKTSTGDTLRYQEFESAPDAINPIKDLHWEEAPVVVVLPTLAELQAQKIEKIKTHRDYLTLQGGHKIGNNWFHSNEISLIQQLVLDGMAKQMSAAGATDSTLLPNIPPWKTKNNGFVQLTVGIAKNFVISVMTQQGALFSAAKAKIIEVEALADPQDVIDYDHEAGFPDVYL